MSTSGSITHAWGRDARSDDGVTPRQACPRPEGLGRNLRSKTQWFAGFCNSHHVSHFATFFIDARAEISVAESHPIQNKNYGATGMRSSPPARVSCVPWRPSRRGFGRSSTPQGQGRRRFGAAPAPRRRSLTHSQSSSLRVSTMILPQVHLRKPCYDFSFL